MPARTNDRDQMVTGFDAYETAWDMVSKRFWNVLGFNVAWFGCFVLATLSLFILCVNILDSWTGFVTSCALFLLAALPLWEGANILRYGADGGFPQRVHELPVVRIIVARFLFFLLVAPAYLMLVLPGVIFTQDYRSICRCFCDHQPCLRCKA